MTDTDITIALATSVSDVHVLTVDRARDRIATDRVWCGRSGLGRRPARADGEQFVAGFEPGLALDQQPRPDPRVEIVEHR